PDGRLHFVVGPAVRSRLRHAQQRDGLPGRLATAVGARVSMAFSEGLSDDGKVSGRGSPWLRGPVCGLMTCLGAAGHTLPFLIPVFLTAVLLAGGVVIAELLLIAYIRKRFMDTPLLAAIFQVVVGGVIVFLAGILIGSA